MFICDCHCDTLTELYKKGTSIYANDQHFDIQRLIALGGGLQFCAIYVPTQEEADQGTVNLPSDAGQQTEGTQENAESGKINLNTADTETLKTLSGIGDAKAQAIIAWREENGSFSSIEDIMQVPGIKESTFTKIKDKIAVE